MAREDKAATVAELTEEFRTSTAAVLTEYRGLTVAQISQLRRSLKGIANYAVVKNTLTKIAAREAGVEGLDDMLAGPSAIAFIKGDPVEGAKSLKNFAKDNPLLVLKAGYMDGRVLDAAEVKKLADLESREVLLSKLAGAMKASMSQAAALFAAPLSQAARTVEALRVKAEADPSIIGGVGAAAPVADAPADAAPVADAPADAVADAPADAVEDASADAVADAPADAAPVADAPADAVADAPADAVADAPADAVADAPADAVADAPADAAPADENLLEKFEHAAEAVVEAVEHAAEGIAHKVEEVFHHGDAAPAAANPESTTPTEG